MIEIVLRKDIRNYEPKPFFGLTARQLVSIIAVIASSIGSYVLLAIVLGMPTTFAGWIVMAVGGSIGFVGLGKINGLKPEEWLRLRRMETAQPQTMTYQRPCFAKRVEEPVALSKEDKAALKAELQGTDGKNKKKKNKNK